MPTHHNLDRYLDEYIAAAGIAEDRKGSLFRPPRADPASLPVIPCSSPMSGE